MIFVPYIGKSLAGHAEDRCRVVYVVVTPLTVEYMRSHSPSFEVPVSVGMNYCMDFGNDTNHIESRAEQVAMMGGEGSHIPGFPYMVEHGGMEGLKD